MKEGKKLFTATLLALLTVSAYFLADTVDTIIGRSLDAAVPAPASFHRGNSVVLPNRELNSYASVLERGLFGDGTKPSISAAVAVASTTYKLIGTVEGEAFAGAVLDDGTGQAFYQLNRKLPDGSVLTKVVRNKVVLRRPDGADVNVEIVDDTKIIVRQQNSNAGVKRGPNGTFVVDQREVLASTKNMSQVLTQARALPYVEGGKTVGFRMSEIVPGSIYTKIGLQNGDVIQRVNSQKLDNPAKFFQLYQGLQNERSIVIDLIRNGQPQTLNYEIR
jgi:general secretion pathway protein C